MAFNIDVSQIIDEWHVVLMCLKCGYMSFHVDVSKMWMNCIHVDVSTMLDE